jgi:phosphoglycolate phosphatase-like HAD superfamily hydrolase
VFHGPALTSRLWVGDDLGVSAAVLLWDFGDTLVDERWMLRAPESCPGWPSAWTEVMRLRADAWDVGRLHERDVFAALAERTGMPADEVERHADECCRSIVYNRVAWRVATEQRRPQALVTVNPDLFVSRVVPAHGLAEMFEVIVVSSVEGTADKVRLCEKALDRLGFDGDRREALLIDNREDVVEAWRGSGGSAYRYRDDVAFEAVLPDLLG